MILKDSPCIPPTSTTLEDLCAVKPLIGCRRFDPCFQDCVWASCGIKSNNVNSTTTELFGTCLPWNTTDERLQEICNSHASIFTKLKNFVSS